MNDHKERWIEAVFQSMKGSKRAIPEPEVLVKIKKQMAYEKASVVTLHKMRHAAAAAALALLMNITGLIYQQHMQVSDKESTPMDAYAQTIISTYQIYE